VFGSDQGLVGQFNDIIADFATKILAGQSGKTQVCAAGLVMSTRSGGVAVVLVSVGAAAFSIRRIAEDAASLVPCRQGKESVAKF